MNDNFTIIKYLNEQEAPAKIRSGSLRRIKILKLRPYIYTVSLAFLANLLFLGNHLLNHIINSEALSVIGVMTADFELSADYINNAFLGLREVLPLTGLGILLVNLVLLIGLAGLFKRYRAELLKI